MQTRRYELLFLLHPDLTEEQIKESEKKYTDLIEQTQGRVLTLNEWGRRLLAYEIKKQTHAFYVLLDYLGDPPLMAEIERQMRLDERVFRFMTVILEQAFDEERYQAELIRREAEEQKRKEEALLNKSASSEEDEPEYEDDSEFQDEDDVLSADEPDPEEQTESEADLEGDAFPVEEPADEDISEDEESAEAQEEDDKADQA